MTDIVCELCSKTFKTESGRRWHVDHLHQLPSHPNHGESNPYEQRDEAADEVEPPSLDDPEQPAADAMSDRTKESSAPSGPETALADALRGTQRRSRGPGP